MTGALKIVVGGMIGAVPGQGGATWAVLQYLLGFTRLGHEVFFVEAVDGSSLNPAGAAVHRSVNARYCQHVMHEHGLDQSWALLVRGTRDTAGLPYESLARIGRQASVLVDISGTLADQELFADIPIRAYLDVDPAFTQLWDAQGIDMRLDGHTHFLTVGQCLGRSDCALPTGGRDWSTTWPPVVLDRWPLGRDIAYEAFTTVANWRAYGSIEHAGVRYGQKVHSLRELMTLPTRTRERILLALSIDEAETADLAGLRANGWQLTSPAEVAGSPSEYRRFITGSKAELGIAKDGYVRSRSGWFSDRSVCYLAAGRPVLTQDTGFSAFLPTGLGLLPFHTEEEALDGIRAIGSDYRRHAAAARRLAEEHFDSDKVLRRLLGTVGADS